MKMLIDVRTPGEYAGGCLPDAVNVPVENIAEGRLGALASVSKDTPLQVYCRSGARSRAAASFLAAAGFGDVEDLGGLHDAAAALGHA